MCEMAGQPPARWGVEFCTSAAEGSPVERFLEGLPFQAQVKVFNLIRLLEDQGVALPFPYSSHVTGRLRELRTQLGKMHLRVLYAATHTRGFILLHGLVKRTRTIPEREIATAARRLEEYSRRHLRRDR